MGRPIDCYGPLEILPGATDAEIKKAWHEPLQVWHPDRLTHARLCTGKRKITPADQ